MSSACSSARPDDSSFELIDGLYAAAAEHGWDLVLSAVTATRDERRALESLADFRLDALVMLGPPVAAPTLAGQLPIVTLGWSADHDQVDAVRVSDEQAMKLAVDHLVDLGHRRIAHLQGGPGLIAVARRDGFERAMCARGLEAEMRIVVCDGEDQIDGQRAAWDLLSDARKPPTGLVAFNDDIAAAAMSVLAQQGLSVPRDVSVVGFDDSALARSPGIDLTTVPQAPQAIAQLAVERIVHRTEGRADLERDVVLAPHLTVRSSTDTAPVS